MTCDLKIGDEATITVKGTVKDLFNSYGVKTVKVETTVKDEDGDFVTVEAPRSLVTAYNSPEPPVGTVGINTGSFRGHWVREDSGENGWAVFTAKPDFGSPGRTMVGKPWSYVKGYFKPLP